MYMKECGSNKWRPQSVGLLLLIAPVSGCVPYCCGVRIVNGTNDAIFAEGENSNIEVKIAPGASKAIRIAVDGILIIRSDGKEWGFSGVSPFGMESDFVKSDSPVVACFLGRRYFELGVYLDKDMRLYALTPWRWWLDKTAPQPHGYPRVGELRTKPKASAAASRRAA